MIVEPRTQLLNLQSFNSEPRIATVSRTCHLTYQSLEGHVSPLEWCHVACQPSPEPTPDHRSMPVNDGQRRQSMVATDGQRWRSTTVDGGGPPLPDHHRTTDQRWLTASQQAGQVGSWAGSGRGQVGSWAGSRSGRPRVSCHVSRWDPLPDVSSDVASHVALTWI
ncbi:hypothetical protein Tco_0304670 [Tanacetum coccineum]